MSDFTSFKDILKNEMRERGITLQQLSESTEISPRYLRALMESDATALPPAPYIRGYLEKIAEVLDVDFSMLWKYYENDKEVQRSGNTDLLPKNRFAIKPIHKGSLFITGIVIVLLAIFFPSITDFFGKPSLEVLAPREESTFSETDHITISGRVGRAQDSVFINGTEVIVQEDGMFLQDVPLSEGVNSFEIQVKRFLGQKTTAVRNVFYKTRPFASPLPTQEPSLTPSTSPSPGPSL